MNVILRKLIDGYDDYDFFPVHYFDLEFDNSILPLEERIFHFTQIGENKTYKKEFRELVVEWVKTESDMTLFSICDQLDIKDFFISMTFSKLSHKNSEGLTFNAFKRILDWDISSDEILMEWFRPFSETGYLHKKFLEYGMYEEYQILSKKFSYVPSSSWTTPPFHQPCMEYKYINKNTLEKLGITKVEFSKADINKLRELGIFPEKYCDVNLSNTTERDHQDNILGLKVLLNLNQLTMEERVIWTEKIKAGMPPWYLYYIEDKDLITDIEIETVAIEDCSIPVIEHFANDDIMMKIITYYDEEKIEYFFGKLTQDIIDGIVERLI